MGYEGCKKYLAKCYCFYKKEQPITGCGNPIVPVIKVISTSQAFLRLEDDTVSPVSPWIYTVASEVAIWSARFKSFRIPQRRKHPVVFDKNRISPVPAVKNILDKSFLTIDDFELIEVNEAFATLCGGGSVSQACAIEMI